jgi:outer membrane protein TolC
MTMIVFFCGVMAIASLYYVFFFPGEVYAGEEKTRLGYLRERKEAVYENLRDLNFEYKAGKVPDVDYQSMRASLEEEAAAIMAEIARLEQTAGLIA